PEPGPTRDRCRGERFPVFFDNSTRNLHAIPFSVRHREETQPRLFTVVNFANYIVSSRCGGLAVFENCPVYTQYHPQTAFIPLNRRRRQEPGETGNQRHYSRSGATTQRK